MDPTEAAHLYARLARTGFVIMYWRPAVLEAARTELAGHGFRVVELDAAGWTTDADLHRDFAATLDFPDYYGHNLDALNDCLRDVVGSSDTATGLALILRHYDAFARRRKDTAQIALDIVADQARAGLLDGHRTLCLVQSDDPDLRFDPVGATAVDWNDTEWLDASRHP
jgi:RNAse (barnase) inhibitor barstar